MLRRFYLSMDTTHAHTHTYIYIYIYIYTHNSTHTLCIIHVHCQLLFVHRSCQWFVFLRSVQQEQKRSPAEETEEIIPRSTVFTCYLIKYEVSVDNLIAGEYWEPPF